MIVPFEDLFVGAQFGEWPERTSPPLLAKLECYWGVARRKYVQDRAVVD